MYVRLINFIDTNNILYNRQYGFRRIHSTQHAMLYILHSIQCNMDSGVYTCDIFIKKAFDTVNHNILLAKLGNYGIMGVINSWFHSYLSYRTQLLEINNHLSYKEVVRCGVPQGSVLGTFSSSLEFSFFLFSDDTTLMYANENLRVLEAIVNLELAMVSEWLKANKLTLNIKKSNFVIFLPLRG